MDPVTIGIGVCVLIIVGCILIIFSPLNKIAISTQTLTVRADRPEYLVAALVRKGWFSTSFHLVGGTVTFFTGSSVFTITPTSVTTTAAAPDAIVTVAESTKGTGTITVNGRSTFGSHDTVKVNVTCI